MCLSTASTESRLAKVDSPPVANWKRAGAVIVGRTNTPAFSLRWHTDNELRGRTYNPWARTRTPGGSSGGAAAAVAAGVAPLAHGNDLGGSSAQSVILMIVVFVLTIFQFRFIERRVHYN